MGLKSFVTNVGLITTRGKYGDNIMSCEYTHQILTNPLQILVCMTPDEATYEQIEETKEFGVNLCAVDQNILSSIAGNNTGKKVYKIAILKELGFTFYDGETIDSLMVSGAVLNAECKLIRSITLNDRNKLFFGQANTYQEHEIEPILYHGGKYYQIGTNISKPSQDKLNKIETIVQKYKK